MGQRERSKAINAIDLLVKTTLGDSAPELAAQIVDCIEEHSSHQAYERVMLELRHRGVVT